jgi:hypothetical protein
MGMVTAIADCAFLVKQARPSHRSFAGGVFAIISALEVTTTQVFYFRAKNLPIPQRTKVPVRVWRLCNGRKLAAAAGQSQRLYSGVGIFNWYYLSSPPQILRCSGAPLELESKRLKYKIP